MVLRGQFVRVNFCVRQGRIAALEEGKGNLFPGRSAGGRGVVTVTLGCIRP